MLRKVTPMNGDATSLMADDSAEDAPVHIGGQTDGAEASVGGRDTSAPVPSDAGETERGDSGPIGDAHSRSERPSPPDMGEPAGEPRSASPVSNLTPHEKQTLMQRHHHVIHDREGKAVGLITEATTVEERYALLAAVVQPEDDLLRTFQGGEAA